MAKKILAAGLTGVLFIVLYASPALSKHRHSFEGGFQDELGRIGAHAAVNLGATLLGSILYGSGLPYGGPGLINRSPGHRHPPVEHHHHHYYEDRIIKKKVYIYEEHYPRRHYRYYERGCDYDHY